VPTAPGVFLAATHSGVTLALVIGKLLADRITSGKYPAMLDPFACHRFAESTESHAVDLH
jgi:glycine/D-amino acid oxidase-like deaminating enzyme